MQNYTATGASSTAVGPELWARLQWDSELWIFASGARMAEPGFAYCEAVPALADDAAAFGIAYLVPAIDVPAALDDLRRRDRRAAARELHEIELHTPTGRVTAFALGRRQPDTAQRKAA